jgi:hypothetical protein
MQKQDSNKDKFSEMIKDKLENYSLPVDDISWNAIEKRLNTKPVKRSLWPWLSGVSAAAAIALLVIILFPNREKNNNYGTTNLLSGYEETISEDVRSEDVLQTVLPPVDRTETIVRVSKTLQNQTEKNLIAEYEVKVEETMAEKTDPNPAPQDNQNPVVKGNQNQPWDIDFSDEDTEPIKKRKKQKSVGLSLGSGGNLLAMNTNEVSRRNQSLSGDVSYAFPSSSDIALKAFNGATAAEDLLSTKDFSKINHYPPLSFGLTVRKELDNIFSLETGIVYTFLHSDFSNALPKREAKLQLHYLGIPLNLNVNIYGNPYTKWDIYLSTGGMVEKGLLSHYTQKQYISNDNALKTTTDENIDGLQWSVAIAPGIDYKLSKNYSLYLEPKLSYYFDNNQPISARTEHPVVFGVNAGFRFTW